MPFFQTADRPRRALATLIIIFIAIGSAWAGPLFAPGRRLSVIKTEHFDIIFSAKSEPSARYLALIAEDVLARASGELGLGLAGRVPVVITPDIGVFNGYASPVPYPVIALYDTPLDPDWTSFEDNLRGLFAHELTHVLSLGSRAPWAEFLSGVFGSWVAPALANAPMFMVEGATVGLEGEGGPGGRAADPLVKQRIRQDIRENRFKSPLECSGVYDEFPGGNLYYEYGGLFTDYLRKRYGAESYAELWKAMGGAIVSFSLDPYRRGFYKAFRKIYGLGFEEAWADFGYALAITGIEDVPERVGPEGYQYIEALAAGGGSLFWVDGISCRGLAMDAATGRIRKLFDADPSTAITDASEDGARLLVRRSVSLPDGRDRIESAVFDVASRRFLPGGAVRDLRAARFFRSGRVGIAANLHDGDLVYEESGERRLLLPGSEAVMYSSPAVIDERRIALIVSIGARRSIGVLDADSGELSLIRPEAGDEGLLDYVRQVSASGGRLWFNHDSDDRMYKLGVLELGGPGEAGGTGELGALRVEDADWSGGVLWPVECEGRVYYAGRFSEGFGLCRAPGTSGAAPGSRPGGERRVAYRLESFDPREAAAAREARVEAEAAALEPSPYRPLAYANPFSCWIPFFDPTTIGTSFRPFAVFILADPVAENSAALEIGYDSAYPFAELGFEWTNRSLPIALGLSAEDTLKYGSSGPPSRMSSAELSASLRLPVFPGPRAFVLGGGGAFVARARGSGTSPYEWPYDGWGAAASLWIGWEGRIVGPWSSAARGADIVSYHDLDLGSATYKTEAELVLSIDRPALGLDLWGAWSTSPILRPDASSRVFASDRRPAYAEYSALDIGESRACLLGAASWRMADQPIRSEFLGLYFSRLILDAGYRGALFGDEYLDSLFARASFDVATALGAAGGIGLRLFAEAYARLDGSALEEAVGFRLGGTLRGDAAP